ncbi:NAD-binding protein [Candidatus Bathyarchaeota archaeon]|nr:NAD-binding protein [Candidatus Bathyarchaeota archaeon]
MRTLLIGGGHSAYFAANAIREIDPDGKLIIIEFTSEKVDVLSKTFSFAELIHLEIDEVEKYIGGNRSILDSVITATESDSLNLRYCKVAKENAIPLTISIINNPLNTEIFLNEGITCIINPYILISRELSEILDAGTNVLYKFQRAVILMVSIKISDERFILQLKRELAQSRDLSAIFVSQSGEITNSVEEVGLGGRAYIIGSEERVEKVLRIARRR